MLAGSRMRYRKHFIGMCRVGLRWQRPAHHRRFYIGEPSHCRARHALCHQHGFVVTPGYVATGRGTGNALIVVPDGAGLGNRQPDHDAPHASGDRATPMLRVAIFPPILCFVTVRLQLRRIGERGRRNGRRYGFRRAGRRRRRSAPPSCSGASSRGSRSARHSGSPPGARDPAA